MKYLLQILILSAATVVIRNIIKNNILGLRESIDLWSKTFRGINLIFFSAGIFSEKQMKDAS